MINVNIDECWGKGGREPIRVRWLDVSEGGEKDQEYMGSFVAQ